MNAYLTACPICVYENTGRMDSLEFVDKKTVKCRWHGEICISDIPALRQGSKKRQMDPLRSLPTLTFLGWIIIVLLALILWRIW
jgi:hypothetical protein